MKTTKEERIAVIDLSGRILLGTENAFPFVQNLASDIEELEAKVKMYEEALEFLQYAKGNSIKGVMAIAKEALEKGKEEISGKM